MRLYTTENIIGSEQIAATSLRRTSSVSRVLALLPVAMLIFAILAFGATPEWARFGLQVGAVVSLLSWTVTQLRSPGCSIPRNPLLAPMLAVAAIAVVQLTFRTTIYAHATRIEIIQYLAYGAVFLAASDWWKAKADRELVMKSLAVFGFALAMFAIIQALTSNGKIYWVLAPRFGGAIFGPYVNRNHYAGIMELLTPVPFVLATMRNRSAAYRALFIFMGTVMAVSIFACQSRAGMVGFCFEMLILAIVLLRIRRSIGTSAAIGFAGVVFVALFALLGGGTLLERFGSVADHVRPAILRDSIAMVAERPLLGWGLGNFPTVYPHFRSFYTDLFINEAHNDVIQFVVEAGLAGLLTAFWFFALLFRRAFRSLKRSAGADASALAGIVGCSGLLFHSFFDFNLHIPANALAFFLFCALSTASDNGEQPRFFGDEKRVSGAGYPH